MAHKTTTRHRHPTATHPNTASNTATTNPPPQHGNTMQHGTQGYNPPPQTHRHTPQHGVQHRNHQPTATTRQHDATQHARLQPATANPLPCTLIRRPTPQPPTHCHGAADDAQDSATTNPLRRHGSYPHHAATPWPHLTIWCDCDQSSLCKKLFEGLDMACATAKLLTLWVVPGGTTRRQVVQPPSSNLYKY
ncbi:hypothetical protein EDB89DRAFT_1910344 [Lactarius sanguifluus]|nr:hypothetical protein EDB89DRAFT_1910344 [Lactarius sanguifluus]